MWAVINYRFIHIAQTLTLSQRQRGLLFYKKSVYVVPGYLYNKSHIHQVYL